MLKVQVKYLAIYTVEMREIQLLIPINMLVLMRNRTN